MAKRGRPRGPCNPRELAQRRGAAWKHGDRAATPLRRAIHPCREDLCPVGYPCSLKSKIDAAGGALEACIVELAVSDVTREAYCRALAEGDLTGLREMVAGVLAAMAGLHQREMLAILQDGGFALEQPVYSKDGEEVGTRLIQNPRAVPWIELSKLIGMSADQQAVTPKARGETSRDISMSRHLDWLHQVQSRLSEGSERGLQAPTEAPPPSLPGAAPSP